MTDYKRGDKVRIKVVPSDCWPCKVGDVVEVSHVDNLLVEVYDPQDKEGDTYPFWFREIEPVETPNLMEVTGTWKNPFGFKFTIGKQYEYFDDYYGVGFYAFDDTGYEAYCLWDNCDSGYTYTKVEDLVEEEEPEETPTNIHPDQATKFIKDYLEENGMSLVSLHLITQEGGEYLA